MREDLGPGCKILEVSYSFVVLQHYVSGQGMLEDYKNQRKKNRILKQLWRLGKKLKMSSTSLNVRKENIY